MLPSNQFWEILGYKSPSNNYINCFVEINICKLIAGGLGDVNQHKAHQCTPYGGFQGRWPTGYKARELLMNWSCPWLNFTTNRNDTWPHTAHSQKWVQKKQPWFLRWQGSKTWPIEGPWTGLCNAWCSASQLRRFAAETEVCKTALRASISPCRRAHFWIPKVYKHLEFLV